MQRVIVESPYAGDVERNEIYARRAMAHCLRQHEAPLASHLLYTQVLDDTDTEQRITGIKAGFTWGLVADYVAVYVDYGISTGMQKGIERAQLAGQRVTYRKIGRNPYTTPYAAEGPL
jgi:hypothetical protein